MSSLIILLLLLIIIFFIIKLICLNNEFKNINKELHNKIENTNNLITTSTYNKNLNNIIISLNKELSYIHKKELEYKENNQELYKLITDITHDLKTPLTAIKGYIDLLDKEYKKEYISVINNNIDNINDLIDNLFLYSSSLDNDIKFEYISINTVLEEVILSFYALFKKNNITPKINICTSNVYRYVNKSLLIRIFENIISNAIKYTSSNIEITLTSNGFIIFKNKTNSLDKTSIEKIFDRYFTVENASKSRGLGLEIAKYLTNINNGKINAYLYNNTLKIVLEFPKL